MRISRSEALHSQDSASSLNVTARLHDAMHALKAAADGVAMRATCAEMCPLLAARAASCCRHRDQLRFGQGRRA